MTPNEATARQAEIGLLGALMLATKIDPALTDKLTVEDFNDARHAAIWHHICAEVREAGPDAPSVVIVQRLKQAGELELAGGFDYVDSFGIHTVNRNYGNAAQCVEAVKHCARLRRIASAAKAAADAADGFSTGATAALVDLRQALQTMDEDKATDTVNAWHALTYDLASTFRGGVRTATPLDDAMPLCPGRMFVIGGRPGHGKTTITLQIALAILSANKDAQVLMASCEMSEPELSLKALCCLDGRNFIEEVRRQGEAAMVNVQGAVTQYADTLRRLHLKPTRSMDTITSEAHRLHRLHPLTCVVVDYMSAMTAPGGGKYETRSREVGAVSRACKALAQNLDCVVLAASQLNRASKAQAKPALIHLRDTGEAEQDADGVALLHRPDQDDDDAAAQLLIAKNRWGELAALDLVPDLENHRFGWMAKR